MAIKHRIAGLERRAGVNEPTHITLINPDEQDIERARKQEPASLFIIQIGGPKSLHGLSPE